jgi:hypothetical protein
VCSADNGTYCYGTLSRAIDGIGSARRQHRDGALQIIHMLLHLRQRTIIFLLEQCRNEWILAPVQSRTVFLDGAFSVST